jgi:hypothetical protein
MSIDAEQGQTATASDTATRGRRRNRWVVVAVAVAGVVIVAAVVALRDRDAPTVGLNVSGDANGPDAWSAWPNSPLQPRLQHLLVATGSGVFAWGGNSGSDNQDLSDGAYFDGSTRTWRRLPESPLARNAGNAIGVWTGAEVIVVNGREGDVRAAAFDPVSFTWRSLPDVPLEHVASMASQIVDIDGTIVVFDEGEGLSDNHVVRLDEGTGTWLAGTPPPVHIANTFDAVSIGDRAVVAVYDIAPRARDCGSLHLLTYRPVSDAWAELPGGPATKRMNPVVVWTGSELFVGGADTCVDPQRNDGSSNTADLYDPATDAWRAASNAPVGFGPLLRYADVWTGRSVVAVQGDGHVVMYNPKSDSWHVGPTPLAAGQWLADTPVVALDGSIVISGGAVSSTNSNCCPFSPGTYAYQPPPGY